MQHRAELDHPEGPALPADARLGIENRAGAIEADDDRQDQHDGQQQRQRSDRAHQLDDPAESHILPRRQERSGVVGESPLNGVRPVKLSKM